MGAGTPAPSAGDVRPSRAARRNVARSLQRERAARLRAAGAVVPPAKCETFVGEAGAAPCLKFQLQEHVTAEIAEQRAQYREHHHGHVPAKLGRARKIESSK
jgi:hypothetical protein